MSTINTGESLQRFTEDKWFAYSGVVQGDVSVPASITLVDIPNSGLRNSFVKIIPFFGRLISGNNGSVLGIKVLIDGVEIIDSQHYYQQSGKFGPDSLELFVPKQSRIEVISLNTSNNNNQTRGCTVLGWYV